MPKTKQLRVRLDDDTHAKLAKAATNGPYSVSDLARTAIEQALSVAPVTSKKPTAEIGITGLLQTSGFLYEEWEQHLRQDRAMQVYLEMWHNSATVQGVLFALDMLARQVDWRVEQGGESPEDLRARDFVDSLRHDLNQSWADCLSEILSMLVFGWSYHEIVYKWRRGGDPLQPGVDSRFTDGLMGWRKLPIRAQITRWRWEFDDAGGIRGMWQAPWGLGGGITAGTQLRAPVFIPIEKALLFRPRTHKNNPEGQSLLRGAYRAWYFAKRLEEIEAVGIERDLAGFPTARIPSEHIVANTATFTNWKQMVRNIRRNDQEGLVLPSDRDEHGEYLYDFALLSTGGRRQIEIEPALERYDRRIAMTMLADFLFLGQGGSAGRSGGAYALVNNRASLFGLAIDAVLDSIASVFNRHAIPRVLAYNGFNLEKPPRLEHGRVEIPDPQALAAAIKNLADAGMPIFPDVALENVVREYLGVPKLTEDEVKERDRHDPTPGIPAPVPEPPLDAEDDGGPEPPPPDGPAPDAGASDATAARQEFQRTRNGMAKARQQGQPAPTPRRA